MTQELVNYKEPDVSGLSRRTFTKQQTSDLHMTHTLLSTLHVEQSPRDATLGDVLDKNQPGQAFHPPVTPHLTDEKHNPESL